MEVVEQISIEKINVNKITSVKWLNDIKNNIKHTEMSGSFIENSREIAEKYLPEKSLIRHSLINLKGIVEISGLPLDDIGSLIPKDGQRPLYKSNITEAVILGIISCLDLFPFGYLQEKQGRLVHEIIPISGYEKSQSSNGLVELGFHSDAACLPRNIRPFVLALFCLIDNTCTSTQICCVQDVLNLLPKKVIETLSRNLFIHSPPESFRNIESRISSILEKHNGVFEIALSSSYSQGITQEAELSLNILKRVINKCIYRIQWDPGKMALFNNLKCLHGRSHIRGNQRWLQRCYAQREPVKNSVIDLDEFFNKREVKLC